MLVILSLACILAIYILPLFHNVMFTWEIIFPLVLSVPLILYGRRSFKLLLLLFAASQSVTVIARYILFPILIENHQLLTPISKDVMLVKQCIGLSQIIGWVAWSILLIIYCRHKISKIISEQTDFDAIMHNKKIARLINIYTITTATLIILFALTIFMFDLYNYLTQIMIFIVIALVCVITIYWEIIRTIRIKKVNLLNEKDDDNSAAHKDGVDDVNRENNKESELSVLSTSETSIDENGTGESTKANSR